MLITFEGADGSGKSTQIKFTEQYLKGLGYNVVITRDPGGTELGLHFREILLNYTGQITDLAEMFIFLADRAQHVELKIKPLLEQGVFVLCDRYIDSTVAYQGYGRGIPIDQVELLNKIATNNTMPDLTLLFNVSTEVGMKRVAKGGSKDRLESEVKEFHQKVSEGYLELARKDPDRFAVIDADKPIEEVKKQVKTALDNLLSTKSLKNVAT